MRPNLLPRRNLHPTPNPRPPHRESEIKIYTERDSSRSCGFTTVLVWVLQSVHLFDCRGDWCGGVG